MAFVGDPPLFLPEADEVHVSCAFTWDKPEAERLAKAWANHGYKVLLGGPAYGSPAGEFTPGMYVKTGMTITSRGCIRRCPFCFVPQRKGPLRLLDIKPGWDILDNNLLACPRQHVEAVLDMLPGQPRARPSPVLDRWLSRLMALGSCASMSRRPACLVPATASWLPLRWRLGNSSRSDSWAGGS